MSDKYKKLYEAQKKEHEKTWAKLRKTQKEAQAFIWNYEGAMEDNRNLANAMRKHVVAMMTYLDANYPIKRPGGE